MQARPVAGSHASRKERKHQPPNPQSKYVTYAFERFAWSKPLLTLALYTALRRSDLRLLTWTSVDLQAGVIRLVMRKTKRPVLLPIVPRVRAALDACRKRTAMSEYVLVTPEGRPYAESTIKLRATKHRSTRRCHPRTRLSHGDLYFLHSSKHDGITSIEGSVANGYNPRRSTPMSRRIPLLIVASLVLSLSAFAEEPLTFYLADDLVGVAGVFRHPTQTLFFEVLRQPTPAGGEELVARLLDEEARPVALMGPDNDHGGRERRIPRGVAYGAFIKAVRESATLAEFPDERDALLAIARPSMNRRWPARGVTANALSHSPLAIEAMETELHGTYASELRFEAFQHSYEEQQEDGTVGERIEVYARLADREGRTIAAFYGGDERPETWATNDEEADDDQHRMRVGAALATGRRLARTEVPINLAAQQEALVQLAASLERALLPINEADLPSTFTEEQPKVRVMAAPKYYYKQTATIYKGKITTGEGGPSLLGTEHSATRIQTLRSTKEKGTYTFLLSEDYGNHGRGPTGSGMSSKCSTTTPARTTYAKNIVACKTFNHPLSLCDLAYLNSNKRSCGSYSTVSHNCHDDTSLEYQSVKYGTTYNPCGGTCATCSATYFAPSCN